jgi:hypothetical protein
VPPFFDSSHELEGLLSICKPAQTINDCVIGRDTQRTVYLVGHIFVW